MRSYYDCSSGMLGSIVLVRAESQSHPIILDLLLDVRHHLEGVAPVDEALLPLQASAVSEETAMLHDGVVSSK